MSIQRLAQPDAAALTPTEGEVAALLPSSHELRPVPDLEPLSFTKGAPSASTKPALESVTGLGGPWDLPPRAEPILVLALNSRWHCYREALRTCRKRFSEEAVHQLRVAARRLMAQLVLLSSVTHAPEAEQARRLLKRRLKAMGALRDAHVLRLLAERETRRFPELVLVREFLERRERRLEKSVAAKVKKYKTRKLEQWVLAVGQRLVRGAARARQPDRLTLAAIEATAGAYREVVRRRQAIDPAHAGTIHRTRIAFKRFRYMVESLSPDFTGLDKQDLEALARYQRRMGDLQDLEVMQACLDEFVRERQPAEPLLRPFYQHLQRRRRRALGSFLKSADELYRFWPPAAKSRNGHPVPALHAA